MINRYNIIIKEKYGTYQIEARLSGMYLVWNECEDGKWVGLASVKTPIAAHKIIGAYEDYLQVVEETVD